MPITLENKLRGSIKDMLRTGSGVCEDAAVAMEDALREIDRWRAVSAPSPCADDYQVSKIDGPDYDPAHFMGGVEAIERNGSLLIFKFVGGGQVCVNGAVTYQAPETH